MPEAEVENWILEDAEGGWSVLVAQLCPTLCNPMDCSLPGSSVHGILQAKNTGMGCHSLLQRVFLTQGLNPGLPHSGSQFRYRKLCAALLVKELLRGKCLIGELLSQQGLSPLMINLKINQSMQKTFIN